jgi:hypothetical protein
MTILHQHVVIRRRYIDTARKKRLFVFDVNYSQQGRILEKSREQIVGMTTSMLDDYKRDFEIRRHRADQAAQRRQAAPGCADDNNRSAGHITFR